MFADNLNLGKALVDLCKASGARSGWIQRGDFLVESNLLLAEARAVELVVLVHEMLESYARVDRTMESCFFGFGDQILFLIVEGELRVTLCFDQTHDDFLEAVVHGRRMLKEFRPAILLARQAEVAGAEEGGEIVESGWELFRPKLRVILVRVLNSAQADRTIERALEKAGCSEGPANEQIVEIAEAVIAQVPHRGKRQSLEAELEDLLSEHQF